MFASLKKEIRMISFEILNIDRSGILAKITLQLTLTFWVNETFLNSFLQNAVSNDLTKTKLAQNVYKW